MILYLLALATFAASAFYAFGAGMETNGVTARGTATDEAGRRMGYAILLFIAGAGFMFWGVFS